MVGAGKGRRTRELLVVAEVALSVVLLSGAGLLMKSLSRLQAEDVGFDPEGVVVGRMTLPDSRYPDEASVAEFGRELMRQVEALPGVTSAGLALAAPFAGGAATFSYDVEGIEPGPDEDFSSEYQVATPDYFETMGIPILEGRGLEAADEAEETPMVAVVSRAFARRHWGDGEAVGHRIRVTGDEWIEIVGVSGNVRHFSFDRVPRPEIYVPFLKDPWPFLALVVKTAGDPVAMVEPVRRAVLAVDAQQPIAGLRPMLQVLRESVGDRRFTVELLGLFAALAMGLALVGVYGIMAYMVSLRVQEIGIRVALGASRREVLWLSLREGVRLAVLGLVIGVVGSLALTRVLRSLLYGVSPWDPTVLATAAVLLTGAVVAAAYLPARRAAGLPPARVLRSE